MFSIAFLVVFYPILQPCFAIETNVTRSLQDTFSVSNCTSCAKFNQATCFREGVCQCPSVESTFFIYKQRCESSASLIIGECAETPILLAARFNLLRIFVFRTRARRENAHSFLRRTKRFKFNSNFFCNKIGIYNVIHDYTSVLALGFDYPMVKCDYKIR